MTGSTQEVIDKKMMVGMGLPSDTSICVLYAADMVEYPCHLFMEYS